MSSPHCILVLGAGELGTPILSSLSTHPLRPSSTKISVLLRPSTLASPSPSKSAELAALTRLGISLVPGDVLSLPQSALVTLFSAYDCIIGANGMTLPMGTQTRILRAVLEAKVPLYFPWQFGIDYDAIGHGSAQDLFSEQLDVRNALRAQTETQWVVVSTGMFMSFLFEAGFGVVDLEKRIVRALGGWENKITVTAVEDIGRVVTEIVFAATEARDGVAYTAGETVEFGRLADVVEEVMGGRVERECWELKFLKEELEKEPGDGMKKYRVAFAEGKGIAWDEEVTINKKQGMDLIDVRGWLTEKLKQSSTC